MTKKGIGWSAGHWPLDDSRPTLVFIHGAGQNRHFWYNQVTPLAAEANTVALDLPGHGDSRPPARDSVGAYAEAVSAFLTEAAPPRPVVLCGLSMGGAVVLQLLLQEHRAVQAAVLIGTGARLRVAGQVFEALDAGEEHYLRLLLTMAISPHNDTPALRRAVADTSCAAPATTRQDFRACDAFDVMGRLGGIAVPVLVLTGDEDRLTPLKYGVYLSRHLPAATLVTLERAGHLAPLEVPAAVNAAIGDFLARTTGRA
jgi:pimeloyl-ACP methyl ester carboxylesterase